MLRPTGAAILGVLVWIVVASLLNLVLRHGWPAYAAVEQAMRFTLAMMAARLAMSAVASLAGGAAAGRIGGVRAGLGSGVILLLLFLPVHYMIWDRFPVWYHLTFLASLPLLGWAGGGLAGRRETAARPLPV